MFFVPGELGLCGHRGFLETMYLADQVSNVARVYRDVSVNSLTTIFPEEVLALLDLASHICTSNPRRSAYHQHDSCLLRMIARRSREVLWLSISASNKSRVAIARFLGRP